MVGEGVLHECLNHPDVEEVLVLTRKTTGMTHPKMKELVHSDFFNIRSIADKLVNYNTCFFCLGVSSVGMKENEYTQKTYVLTMHVAQVLAEKNTGMTFCYISGANTDSTEKGWSMWARVKGKTENDLMKLPFKKAYMFRPGYMQPTPGLKNTLPYYKYVSWMYPFFRLVFPGFVSTLKELGLAMINAVRLGSDKNVLEVKDIKRLAKS